MNRILLFFILTLPIVGIGQISYGNNYSHINFKDIIEIKGLIYSKVDTTLVTGLVTRYNKKNKAKKYIRVTQGKPDDFGWQRIDADEFNYPEESNLGSALLFVGQPFIQNLPHSSDLKIDTHIEYNKQFIKKEYKDASDRDIIYKNLQSNYFSNLNVNPKGESQKVEPKDEPHKIVYKNGTRLEFYNNKQLRSKGNYVEGKKHGTWKEYYANGNMKSRINYKEGKENGIIKLYHENSEIKLKGRCKDAMQIGEWKFYNHIGVLFKIENFD